jgi:hypothetical protein
MRRLVVLSALAAACSSSPAPERSFRSADANLSMANTGFWFLPPLGPPARTQGTLDIGLQPEVRITDAAGNVIASFTRRAHGKYRLRIDWWRQCFSARWHPRKLRGVFRIHVFQGAVEMGFTDVTLAAPHDGDDEDDGDNNDEGDEDGEGSLPIRFFANRCAPVVCSPIDSCHGAGVCQLATATCSQPVLADDTACTASFGPGICRAGACILPIKPPANVTASVGDAGIMFTWSASDGATSYALLRASSASGPWTEIATTTTGTSLSDGSPPPGVASYYVVEARAAGFGARSNPLGVLARPAAPAGLTATFGQGQVSLSWSAATGATGYSVLRGTVAGGPQAEIAQPTATSFVDTGLTNGVTYYYAVRAHNGAGNGPLCPAVGATPHYTCVGSYVSGDDPNRLLAVRISPPAANVLAASSGVQAFTASGFYRKAPSTPVDVTSLVTWTSSNASVANVSGGSASFGTTAGQTALTASLAGMSGTANLRVWDPARYAKLSSLSAAAPGTWNMSSGQCYRASLTANYSDATSEDVTSTAIWGTSCLGRVIEQDLFVATGPCSDNYGSFSGSLGLGTLSATVSIAVWGPVLSGTCSDAARSPGPLWGVTVTGSSGDIYVGEARQFGAQGYYSDGTTRDISDKASYDTCNPAMLEMAPDGLGTGRGVGSGLVGAAVLDGVSGVGAINIVATPALGTLTALQLSPDNANPALGGTYQLRALGSYSGVPGHAINVTTQATWTSAAASVTPFSGGVGYGAALGKTSVSAALGGLTATGNVRVWSPARLAAITGFSIAGNGNMTHGTSQQWKFSANFSDATSEDISDTALWSPHSSWFGHLTTTGYFTADGAYGGYYIIYVWMGRGLDRPHPVEFGIW